MIIPARPSSEDFETPPRVHKIPKKTDHDDERSQLYRKYIIKLKSLGITDEMLGERE